MIRTVLFDFDGVIAESVDVKTKAFAKLYEAFGPDVVEKVVAYHIANGGVSRFDKIRHYHEEFLGKRIDDEELKRWCDRFSDLVLEGVIAAPYVPGAPQLLEVCLDRYTCFVISGTPQDEIEVIVDRRGLGKYFTGIYGSPRSKTVLAREILSTYDLKPEETLYLGDALADYEAAVATGIGFIGRVPQGGVNLFPADVAVVSDLREVRLDGEKVP